MYTKPILGLAVVLNTLFSTGCSSNPVLYPVQGELTTTLGFMELGGCRLCCMNEVLPRARVEFVPADDNGIVACAITDFQGNFVLETPGYGPGAAAGSYKVVVTIDKEIHTREFPVECAHVDTTPLLVEVPVGGMENYKLIVKNEAVAAKCKSANGGFPPDLQLSDMK